MFLVYYWLLRLQW